MPKYGDFDNYDLFVISVDDLVFNLNQIRFDFGKLLYEKLFENVNYEQFNKNLGTSLSTYSFLPPKIAEIANKKIEGYIFNEKNYHNIKNIEFTTQVLKLLHEKNKKIVLVCTNSAKEIEQILIRRGLNLFVDQLIPISKYSGMTPSSSIFKAISDYYKVDKRSILVVSSMESIHRCLEGTGIATMYIPEQKNDINDLGFKPTYIMGSMFNFFQFVLHGEYSSTGMFDSLLGFDKRMSQKDIDQQYDYLSRVYRDDKYLLPLVKRAYEENSNIKTDLYDTKEFEKILPEETVEALDEDTVANIIQQELNKVVELTQVDDHFAFDHFDLDEFQKEFIENKEESPFLNESEDIMEQYIEEETPSKEEVQEEVEEVAEVDEEIVETKEEETQEKPKKKIRPFRLILSLITSLIQSVFIVAAFCALHVFGYSYIELYPNLKKIYDSTILLYPKLSETIFSFLSPYMQGFSEQMVLFAYMVLTMFLIHIVSKIVLKLLKHD